MTTEHEWRRVAVGVYDGERPLCPSCSKARVEFCFAVDEGRRGFLVVWCPLCLCGLHLSRVEAPEGVPVLDIEDDEAIQAAIPKARFVS